MKNILLFVFSALLSFAMLEVVSRLFLSVGNNWTNDTVWAREKWLEDRQNNLLEASTKYIIDRYDSIYGWTLAENLQNIACKGGWRVSSNTKGVRGKQEHDYANTDKLRMVAIGDSYTFGECVADSETFPAKLEILLGNTEVINLAVHGYGQDQQLLKLKNEGVKYQPDYILLGFFNDDINRNKVAFRDYAKPYFSLSGDSLTLNGVPVPDPQKIMSPFPLKSIRLLRCKWAEMTEDFDDPLNYEISSRILSSMVEISQGQKARFILAYIPTEGECISGISRPHSLFTLLSAKSGVITVNPTQRINRYLTGRANQHQYFECHFTADIYNIIAEEIATAIKKENLHALPQ